MASADTGKLEYESARTLYAMAAITDSGDQKKYTTSATFFSRFAGAEPDVRPNGVISGCELTPGSSNDEVDISAGEVYLAGAKVTVSAGTVAVTRDGSNSHKIISITVSAAGALAEAGGTAHASAHSETRAASGGPALIATNLVEIGQVRVTSITAAKLTAAEIKTTLNVHREGAFFPAWTEDDASAEINFNVALMQNHTGPVAKVVQAEYSDPSFSEQIDAVDFVPVTETSNQGSTQVYNSSVGNVTKSLSQGGFTFYPREGVGVTDALMDLDGKELWFKFFPKRAGTRHTRGKGVLGVTPTYPAGDNISVACTISGSQKFTYHAS